MVMDEQRGSFFHKEVLCNLKGSQFFLFVESMGFFLCEHLNVLHASKKDLQFVVMI